MFIWWYMSSLFFKNIFSLVPITNSPQWWLLLLSAITTSKTELWSHQNTARKVESEVKYDEMSREGIKENTNANLFYAIIRKSFFLISIITGNLTTSIHTSLHITTTTIFTITNLISTLNRYKIRNRAIDEHSLACLWSDHKLKTWKAHKNGHKGVLNIIITRCVFILFFLFYISLVLFFFTGSPWIEDSKMHVSSSTSYKVVGI